MDFPNPFFLGFIAGVAAAIFVGVSALRRAKTKPNGTTAKMVEIAGGGGPDPKTP